MLHVHARARMAVLNFLRGCKRPVSAERVAENVSYSVIQTKRTLAALRAEGLLSSWRPQGSHALAYEVDEETARELGLL